MNQNKEYNKKILNELLDTYKGMEGIRKEYEVYPYKFRSLFLCTSCNKHVSATTAKYYDFAPDMKCFSCQRV